VIPNIIMRCKLADSGLTRLNTDVNDGTLIIYTVLKGVNHATVARDYQSIDLARGECGQSIRYA